MMTTLKTQLKSKAVNYIKNKGFDVYSYSKSSLMNEDIEDYFETSDGRSIPVLKHHRYKLKKAWAVFGPIMALQGLEQRGLLDTQTKRYLKEAKGYRTPAFSMYDIRTELAPFLEKHSDLFLSTNIPDLGSRFFKPEKNEVDTLIQKRSEEHKKLLNKISSLLGCTWDGSKKVLEIGYTSGGESIIGFEKLGLQAYGLDYFYDDNFETNRRYEHVVKLANSKTKFLIGDITKKTVLEEDSMDLIYTQSVLEHIKELPDAFAEMYRVLKPGGIMFHRYDPYFHIKGGHPPCTLDAPWAHMRLHQEDIERYIKQFRPNEVESTLPWIKNALNRIHNQTFVQKALMDKGFKIYWWQNTFVSPQQERLLTPEIISECFSINPNISLDDLLSYAVSFIAIKPKK